MQKLIRVIFSNRLCAHVGEQRIRVAYDKHAAHKRVYELPIKALLQVVQYLLKCYKNALKKKGCVAYVLLLQVQQVAHVRQRLRAHGVGGQKLRERGCSRSRD